MIIGAVKLFICPIITVSVFLFMFSFVYQHANVQCNKVVCNRIPTCEKPQHLPGLCCKTCPGKYAFLFSFCLTFSFRSVWFA